MPRSTVRTYSRYSREAVSLIGKLIRTSRNELKMTAMEVSERAGISRGLLQRIEKGEVTSEIGAVFEVATIVGIKLFDADDSGLGRLAQQAEGKLALLPKSVRKKTVVVKDDF